MREWNRIYFSLCLALQRKRRTLCMILITAACMVIFSYAIMLYYASNYNYITSDEIYVKGLKNTGTILIEETSDDFDYQLMDDIIRDIREIEGVYALGESNGGVGFNGTFFEAYADNPAVINGTNENGSVVGFSVTADTAKICHLNLLSGTSPDQLVEDENTHYIYLGYDFRDIPEGTLYERELPNGKTFKLVVAGVLKKGQRWIDAIEYAFFNCNTLSNYEVMDGYIMVCSSSISSFPAFFNIEDGYEFKDVKDSILKLEKKYGVTFAIGSIEEKYVMAEEQRAAINNTLNRCMITMIAAALSFLVCLQVIEFYQNKRQYGLYYSIGMTEKDVNHIVVWKKAVESVLASAIAYVLTFYVCRVMFAVYSDVNKIISEVMVRYVLGWLIGIGVFYLVLSSAFIIIAMRKYTLMELLERGE